MEKIGAQMPVIPVKVCSNTGSHYVYVLLYSGSQEMLISSELFDSFKLDGDPCKCILVMANNECFMIDNNSTSFRIWAFDANKTFAVKDALVLNSLPDISGCLPFVKNLAPYHNVNDLILKGKFPTLPVVSIG